MPTRIDQLLKWARGQSGWPDARLRRASSDASFRQYFRLSNGTQSRIVMDAPPENEPVHDFLKVARALQGKGLHAPRIFAADTDNGFVLLEDLGDLAYLDALSPDNADRLYRDAITALCQLQSIDADDCPVAAYDRALLTREMTLFSEWLLGKHLKIQLDREQKNAWQAIQQVLIENALEQPQVFVHRDYHSRNLMSTVRHNPGIIDFQDAVRGPISYDLVSLLRDCYIAWPDADIERWIDFYLAQQSTDAQFTRGEFQRWFDLMGVQRHLKASGIFARLHHRDGKSAYLADIPRTLAYIAPVCARYAELAPLRGLIDRVEL